MDQVVRGFSAHRLIPVIMGLSVSVGVASHPLWRVHDAAAETARSSQPAERSTRPPEDMTEEARMQEKLDTILATQQTILQRFDAVLEELRIIKVRSASAGGGS